MFYCTAPKLTGYRSSFQGQTGLSNTMSAPFLLLLMRLIRVWNQTGQKYAGEPDIAKNVLSIHTYVLWFAVTVTYLSLAVRLWRSSLLVLCNRISSIASFILCAAALRFKISFTSADAPELLLGFPRTLLHFIDGSSLVAQCRIVFIGIGVAIILSVSTRIYRKSFLMQGNEGGTYLTHHRDNF